MKSCLPNSHKYMLTYLSMFLQLSEPSGIVEGSNGNALFASIYFIILLKMFSYYIDLWWI